MWMMPLPLRLHANHKSDNDMMMMKMYIFTDTFIMQFKLWYQFQDKQILDSKIVNFFLSINLNMC